MISLDSVCLGTSQMSLFSHIHLQIPRGESFGIIGPSGVGKTVLLKLIAGLIRPTQGRVEVEGSLAMTFQRSGLFDSMTAEENLHFPLTERRLPKEEIEKRTREALADVGLSEHGRLFPHEMSGGMQKRLAIARALVLKSEVILFDDPTAGLDPVTSRTIVNLILNLKKKYGITFIAVSSDLKVAYALSDRIGFLCGGDFVETGSVEGIRHSENPVVQQFVRGEVR